MYKDKNTMQAMVLNAIGQPLKLQEIPIPEPLDHQVLIKVLACGICRTDLHIIDGELQPPKLPLILGHQIVGVIIKKGSYVNSVEIGDRVGIPWFWKSCNRCDYCLSGNENLCDQAFFTGYHVNGGFAQYCVAFSDYIFPIPSTYTDIQAAPLLCAGMIGYRCLKMVEHSHSIGFFGFGASAHLLIQYVNFKGGEVFAFTKAGDTKKQNLAKKLGAIWTGGIDEISPKPLDAAIIFAPIGSLVPLALRAVKKGGTVICAGIHMSDIPTFPYEILWGERVLRSVANLTRQDGTEFLSLASKIPIKTEVNIYSLEQINEAIKDLRHGQFSGSAVIKI